MVWKRLNCWRLLQAMSTTEVGAKNNPVLGPVDGWIMQLEPGHADDDRVATEARDVEPDVLSVRTELHLNGECFVRDGTGRDGTSIDDL